MKKPIYVRSFSAILDEGIYSPAGFAPWPQGQNGIFEITREQVLAKPYPAFGKLCLSDKLAFCAASVALSHCPVTEPLFTGICLGLPLGSLSTDLRYMESVLSAFPSPALFSATLPSSAIADIAIFFGLKGENRVFVNESDSGYTAMENAVRLLQTGKCNTVAVLYVLALEEKDFALLGDGNTGKNRAYALILSTSCDDGGKAMALEFKSAQPNKDQPCDSGELYFHSIMQLLHTRSAGSVPFNGNCVAGHFSMKKDVS